VQTPVNVSYGLQCPARAQTHLGLMKDSAEKRGFRWWVRWYLRASYTLMWGLLLTTQGSEWLLQDRFSSVLWPWRGTIRLAAFLSTLWMLWALWPREESEAEKSWAGVLLLWAVSFGVLTWQREHGWAVVGTSVEIALFLAWWAKLHRRSLILAIVGWSLAGPAVFVLPWSNGQRFDLVLVLGGFATALQGGFGLARDLITLRRQSEDIVADSC